ncbi:asparaginase [Aureimonas sp. AU12]|uniref:asparaginase n=1 Tax=Aureimonas sp. AU12 TaxID=1638161 RepID=UPI000705932B|nr:asparaginase [Aureimonas sp. AU12]BAT29645.1 L-asparaginase [Aureimonas sp. AU12]
MAQIQLITTGGTIASRPGGTSSDVVADITGAELRAGLHDPLEGIGLDVDDFCRVGSSAIELPLAFALARRIAEHLARPDCDGVVVTHGTDTMEESAFLADLLVDSDKPVVFTGAQRSADAPDTDGPRNIANAVRLAASPLARGLGAMIAFEDEFHAARDVTKTHTSRTDTFRSGEHGKLGEIDGGVVSLHRRPVLRRTYAPARLETEVDLIKLAMGTSDRMIRAAASGGARAIVVEGFGRGNPTPAITAAIGEIVASGTAVIMCSRCPEGRVRPIYGNGAGKDAERAGAIFAGDLAGVKARILACVLLGEGADMARLREEITFFGG